MLLRALHKKIKMGKTLENRFPLHSAQWSVSAWHKLMWLYFMPYWYPSLSWVLRKFIFQSFSHFHFLMEGLLNTFIIRPILNFDRQSISKHCVLQNTESWLLLKVFCILCLFEICSVVVYLDFKHVCLPKIKCICYMLVKTLDYKWIKPGKKA